MDNLKAVFADVIVPAFESEQSLVFIPRSYVGANREDLVSIFGSLDNIHRLPLTELVVGIPNKKAIEMSLGMFPVVMELLDVWSLPKEDDTCYSNLLETLEVAEFDDKPFLLGFGHYEEGRPYGYTFVKDSKVFVANSHIKTLLKLKNYGVLLSTGVIKRCSELTLDDLFSSTIMSDDLSNLALTMVVL